MLGLFRGPQSERSKIKLVKKRMLGKLVLERKLKEKEYKGDNPKTEGGGLVVGN